MPPPGPDGGRVPGQCRRSFDERGLPAAGLSAVGFWKAALSTRSPRHRQEVSDASGRERRERNVTRNETPASESLFG
jgi:hypothetical protein